MNKKLLWIVLFVSIFFSTIQVSLADRYKPSEKMVKIFSYFKKKINKKYSNKTEKIKYLEEINKKFRFFLENKKLTSDKKRIVKDIIVLVNEEIFETKKSLENINENQIKLEKTSIENLKKKLEKIKDTSISELLKNNSKIKIIKVSENQEFVENNTIKKIFFNKYFEINNSNSKYFSSKEWYLLIKSNWKNWFVEKLWVKSIEEKIPYSKAYNHTKWFINDNKRYFEDKNIFFSYNFKNFTYLEDKYWFYKSNLLKNKLDIKNSILYLSKDWRYNFIKDFQKTKLISSDIIYWVVDKDLFLKQLVNDKLHISGDTDYLFKKLKKETLEITKWLKKEEKIKELYSFVLNNISYTKEIDLEDKKIFSWILSYKNKDWVCEWYAKLFSYALKFAEVEWAEVIRWDVIDAQDFPQIWHAWVKVWELYYDTTFDDPVWLKEDRKYDEYVFFALPKDLFYANRYNYGDTPEDLKTKSIDYRTSIVNKNLSKLSDKYKNKKYLILKWVDFNKSHNIEVWKKIEIEDAKKIIPFYEVEEKENWEIVFYKKWIKKNITKLQYFSVDDYNIEKIFVQRNYKTQWLYLFDWKKKDWSKEWRIGFDVEIK